MAIALSTLAKSPVAVLTLASSTLPTAACVCGRRRGCKAADLERQIDVVGVVAQARLQERIELVHRSKGAGKSSGRSEEPTGRARCVGRSRLGIDADGAAQQRHPAADVDQVALARAVDLGKIGGARALQVVAGDSERADRVAGRYRAEVSTLPTMLPVPPSVPALNTLAVIVPLTVVAPRLMTTPLGLA